MAGMIAPDAGIYAFAEEQAEAKTVRILRKLKAEHGPDVAEAAIEGIVRAISVHIGGGQAAFDVFTRAADAAIVPALKTSPRVNLEKR